MTYCFQRVKIFHSKIDKFLGLFANFFHFFPINVYTSFFVSLQSFSVAKVDERKLINNPE